jgi:uncharacterized protein
MRLVFADTSYWIATINPRDNLHDRAMAAVNLLWPCKLITSDMVLVEVLNAFAERGDYIRQTAAAAIQAIAEDAGTEVVPQTRRLFQEACALYRQRLDKGWSLTDCASFVIMDERGIANALTYDAHFEQNGYVALLREKEPRS